MKNSNTTKTAKPLRNLTPQAKPIQTLQELAKNLRSDCFYFLEPYSAGDIYYLCALKPALEQRLKGKIIFVIKPSHQAVLELFNDNDYVVVDNAEFERFYIESHIFLEFENVVAKPALGKIYPAHTSVLQKPINNYQNSLEWTLQIVDLPLDTKAILPTNLPKISENLKAKLNKIAPLDKIILFCPEANSCKDLPPIIFRYECQKLREQGFFVLVNISKIKYHRTNNHIDYSKYLIDGCFNLNLSLQEALSVAFACAGVISTRSGLCDIIAPHCDNFKVYYTEILHLWFASFSKMALKHYPKEIYIKDVPIYKAFLQLKRKFYEISLPLKLYNRYIAKGFLKRLRTPFTAYFNIYKKHRANETQNEIKQNIMRDFGRDFGLNETEIETFSEIQNELESTYEYQLGRLLEKACKAFWCGGFLAFPFAYLKLRKQKKKLVRLNEILG